MNKLLIHNDNVAFQDSFEKNQNIKFINYSSTLDELKAKEFDFIYIKDNLSSNYLELYGLVLAYHIRLSQELGAKRFLPIVIISDLDGFTLNRLESMAKILFTKNVFIIKNNKEAFDNKPFSKFKNLKLSGFKSKIKNIKPLTEYEYKSQFLNFIEVKAPENSPSHSIANKWAIDRWATFIDAKSEAIIVNRNEIFSMLYFKYLLAKNKIENSNDEIIFPKKEGKILLIDDEASKGWGDILERLFENNKNIDFEPLDYDFKNQKELSDFSYYRIDEKVKEFNPDVVILDLRLIECDNETDINSFVGIQILQKIHKINAGIQVIMLSATSKSIILEKLYEYKILGYIKKEHPDDISTDTILNINKFVKLVDRGLEKKYLKDIWSIQKAILGLNLFEKNDEKIIELKYSIVSIFDTLNSNISNPLNYGMFSIFKCIEIITYLYVEEKERKAYWRDSNILLENTGYYQYRKEENLPNIEHIIFENRKYYKGDGNISVENKIRTIMHKFGIKDNELHSQVKCIVCMRNKAMHQDKVYEDKDFCKKIVEKELSKKDIKDWFKMLQTILITIDSNLSPNSL